METLVSDTSVLIGLDRGTLVEATFRLPFEFTVPDLLCERELKEHGGPDFVRLGLRIAELDGDGVSLALGYRRKRRPLSLPDSFAIAVAKTNAGRCYPGTGSCGSSQKKRKSDATECCGCSTRCSSSASSTWTTCMLDSARLPPICGADFPSRRSASGYSPIPFADPFIRFFLVNHCVARPSVG